MTWRTAVYLAAAAALAMGCPSRPPDSSDPELPEPELPDPKLPEPAAKPDIVVYGEQCAALIAPIPAFNCLDGEIIPITEGGAEPAEYRPGMVCDRPSLVPYGNDTDGPCTPYSRVLLLADGDAQISALCRRKRIRDAKSPLFDEVDLIAHSVVTGATCWFRATAKSAGGMGASRVPPPSEEVPPPGQIAAHEFWSTPVETAAASCGACHDSDPFMYSPYIGQVWHRVPRNPFGYYTSALGPFTAWPAPHAVTTRGNPCTSCHRIGNQLSCREGLADSTGGRVLPAASPSAAAYPHSHWMPPGNFRSQAEWNIVYRDAVNALAACCGNPADHGCTITPIPSALEKTATGLVPPAGAP